jgi:hypothetical protein
MFARNSELLGELAHEGAVEPLREWKGELAREQFQLLREHGLMRTDLDIDTQQYVLGAVQTLFYLHQPAPGSAGAAPEAVAATLSHTIHAAVQPPGTPDPDVLAAVVPAVLASYQRFRTSLAAAIIERPTKAVRPA